jgi:hypothetical protein
MPEDRKASESTEIAKTDAFETRFDKRVDKGFDAIANRWQNLMSHFVNNWRILRKHLPKRPLSEIDLTDARRIFAESAITLTEGTCLNLTELMTIRSNLEEATTQIEDATQRMSNELIPPMVALAKSIHVELEASALEEEKLRTLTREGVTQTVKDSAIKVLTKRLEAKRINESNLRYVLAKLAALMDMHNFLQSLIEETKAPITASAKGVAQIRRLAVMDYEADLALANAKRRTVEVTTTVDERMNQAVPGMVAELSPAIAYYKKMFDAVDVLAENKRGVKALTGAQRAEAVFEQMERVTEKEEKVLKMARKLTPTLGPEVDPDSQDQDLQAIFAQVTEACEAALNGDVQIPEVDSQKDRRTRSLKEFFGAAYSRVAPVDMSNRYERMNEVVDEACPSKIKITPLFRTAHAKAKKSKDQTAIKVCKALVGAKSPREFHEATSLAFTLEIDMQYGPGMCELIFENTGEILGVEQLASDYIYAVMRFGLEVAYKSISVEMLVNLLVHCPTLAAGVVFEWGILDDDKLDAALALITRSDKEKITKTVITDSFDMKALIENTAYQNPTCSDGRVFRERCIKECIENPQNISPEDFAEMLSRIEPRYFEQIFSLIFHSPRVPLSKKVELLAHIWQEVDAEAFTGLTDDLLSEMASLANE